ncbi:MAG: trigger factor [Ignavibacteriaceae bacterium]
MEYNVVELNSSEKEVEIKLQYEEIKKNIDDEVRKQAKSIQMPGFRKGKVPLTMIKKMYGDALEYEASEKVANSFFWKIAQENELKPIGQPSMTDLKFEPEKDLTFKVKYETIPTLNVTGYKDISFDLPDFIVTDAEIDKEIAYILNSNRVLEDAEIIDSDKYVIDAEINLIEKDGEPVSETKPEKMQIDLTADGIAKEIIENANGKKVGESFNFSYKDEHKHQHEDGTEEAHKQEFKYSVNVLGIKKVVTPELSEELIKKVTKDKVSTEAELREEIKKDIQNYYDQQTEELTRSKLISEIIKSNEFTPPQTLVNNILEEYVKSEEEQAKKSNYPFKKEEAKTRLLKSAETEVKWYLIKSEIQKSENIAVTDDDLKELAEKDSVKTGIPVEKLLNYYKTSNQTEKIIDQKLFEFLKSNNKINKIDPDKLKAKQEAINE